jgi:hypothetical protein
VRGLNEIRDDYQFSPREMSGWIFEAEQPVMMLGWWVNITLVQSPRQPPPSLYLSPFWFGVIDGVLGVADGVGAWNTKENGQPALWSRLLMHYWALECEERIKLWKVETQTAVGTGGMIKLGDLPEEEVDAVELLHRAYLRTAVEMERTGGWIGSTTACVALLQRSSLHIVNVHPDPPNLTPFPFWVVVVTYCFALVGRFKSLHYSWPEFPI